VSKSGRTILFVSHNMNAVNSLCSRCVLLRKGTLAADGAPEEVINQYLKGDSNRSTIRDFSSNEKNTGDDVARLLHARLVNGSLQTSDFSPINAKTGIEYTFEIRKPGLNPVPNIHLYTNKGECAFISNTDPKGKFSQPGIYTAVMWIPPHLLNAGTYVAGLALSTLNPTVVHFFQPEGILFEVIEDVNERATEYRQAMPGVVRPLLEWTLEKK